ncbi:hypothetical protein SAMN06265222_101932 [Neorhodopirellula lusitana]|uniref:Uncharacterized protein n=1 Tax=Neorhodopirellula lusitana TaxID=445327 RepID=A0ABY1PTK0_9BACT|nr:hypothetical protein [Neorhodopirellula lusitana]SMP43379.1 hypothetical protein SAMN06265222_101932 [Neorhodopirellula lusitana]
MSTITPIHCVAVLTSLFCGVVTSAHSTPSTEVENVPNWRSMTKWVPPTANAILAMDAEAMFQSELAIQNDWRESHAENFDRNPTMLPPPTNRFLLSTEVDTEHFEPNHELAVIATSTPVEFDEIQKRVEGEVDTISGWQSIRTVRDSYVVPIDNQHVILIRQASRQWAAQQLRRGRDRAQPQLSPVLSDAIDQVASRDSQIVVAVDLADAIPRSAMSGVLRHSGVLQETNDMNSLVDEMIELQGFVLSIRVTDKMTGRLEMVFETEPTQLKTIAKPIMLELLAGAGAVLPEFKEWQAVPRPKRLALQGELTVAGLRRVLSLLSVEPASFEQESSPAEATANRKPKLNPEQVQARATKNYVKRVTRLADGVVAVGKSSNLREQVLWTDRSAKAITRMTTKNIEYEAAKLGRQIAYGMLGIVSAYQEADQNARSRMVSENPPTMRWETKMIPYRTFVTPYGRYYRYRPFNYAQVYSEQNAIHSRQIISEELTKANIKAKELVAQIESDVVRLNQVP